jgi:putative PIN family toxin of toxin-antitoxin system
MRVVIDTNLILSSLLVSKSLPSMIIDAWRSRRFSLITSREQIEELRRATSYPKIAERIEKPQAGKLINALRDVSIFFDDLPIIELSSDPYDNFLLAMAEAGQADYLVSGDKRGVLVHDPFGATRVVTTRKFCEILGVI